MCIYSIPLWKVLQTATSHSAAQAGYHGKDRQTAWFNHPYFESLFWKMFKLLPFSRLKPVSHNPHISLCSVQSTRYVISSVKELLQIFFKEWVSSVLFHSFVLVLNSINVLGFRITALTCSKHRHAWDGVWVSQLAVYHMNSINILYLHTVLVLDLLGLLLKMSLKNCCFKHFH